MEQEEKETLLLFIERYTKELENIKNTLEQEINERYFRFMCMGDDIQCSANYLFKKYHRNINRLENFFK